MKSDKMPYISYADVEYLIKKMDGCAYNPENSTTVNNCGTDSLWIINVKNLRIWSHRKHTLHLGKYYIKTFCESLRKHVKNITDFEKENMLPLTKEELKSHKDARNCYICGGRILKKLSKSINYWKVTHNYYYTGKYRGAEHSICNFL